MQRKPSRYGQVRREVLRREVLRREVPGTSQRHIPRWEVPGTLAPIAELQTAGSIVVVDFQNIVETWRTLPGGGGDLYFGE